MPLEGTEGPCGACLAAGAAHTVYTVWPPGTLRELLRAMLGSPRDAGPVAGLCGRRVRGPVGGAWAAAGREGCCPGLRQGGGAAAEVRGRPQRGAGCVEAEAGVGAACRRMGSGCVRWNALWPVAGDGLRLCLWLWGWFGLRRADCWTLAGPCTSAQRISVDLTAAPGGCTSQHPVCPGEWIIMCTEGDCTGECSRERIERKLAGPA